MGEQLGCDRRVIAESYKRVKARGWIYHSKNSVRSSKESGRKIVDRRPATVIPNFDKFPATVKTANPVSEDAKAIAKAYQAELIKIDPTSKAVKRNRHGANLSSHASRGLCKS